MMRVVLASCSPRRKEILEMFHVPFCIVSAHADEHSDCHDPMSLVQELACRKARATRELLENSGEWDEKTLIIAADTVVATDQEILGKPQDDADAARMLRLLSGKAHSVISGVALLWGGEERTAAERTLVHFAPMREEDIAWYVTTGEPRDKAGAYAVQGLASLYIRGIEGDYFNVVGLPVHRLNEMLKEALGVSLATLAN